MDPAETLDALRRAAAALDRADATRQARRQERDRLIKQAAAEGASAALIGRTVGITRQAVDQVLDRLNNQGANQ